MSDAKAVRTHKINLYNEPNIFLKKFRYFFFIICLNRMFLYENQKSLNNIEYCKIVLNFYNELSIFLAALNKSSTALIDLSKLFFSSLFKLSSITFSTPPFPIITGTPA